MSPYRILARKRRGETLTAEEVEAAVLGAARGTWNDAQVGAFLMACAIRGLDDAETEVLTRAMLESGEQWRLAESVPGVVDKHSTGGVGDGVSLPLSPMLAACGVPVVMLTGRALGHTAGTADKLESIEGLELALDRRRCLELLEEVGMAIGIATGDIAPADRRLYQLRDQTATVSSIPLVVGSILSKKLATGAAGIVFDVKTGDGAIFPERTLSRQLAERLVAVSNRMGCRASALITDMNQPLGRWVGHCAEVRETVEILENRGDARMVDLTVALAAEAARNVGSEVGAAELRRSLESGQALARLERWATAQGSSPQRLHAAADRLAPNEVVLEAERDGWLAAVSTRRIGHLMTEGWRGADGALDATVALELETRIGDRVERGGILARAYLRDADEGRAAELLRCFEIADSAAEAPPVVVETLRADP